MELFLASAQNMQAEVKNISKLLDLLRLISIIAHFTCDIAGMSNILKRQVNKECFELFWQHVFCRRSVILICNVTKKTLPFFQNYLLNLIQNSQQNRAKGLYFL